MEVSENSGFKGVSYGYIGFQGCFRETLGGFLQGLSEV